ncbi:M1 family metallopeptidase [Paractinoplanes lichenicola]|uniref:Aminopeptidase N n=1 Tax=Paractinoplanes lichenicola TaxID=2802976 RepID=A0ABS1VL55_9ACTN|nr:M1 family metallopeptidase [Actinoplanes lichenicola]MBL7255216.1 M1 family metallopeptidase [Actinoplanes lichenicola]
MRRAPLAAAMLLLLAACDAPAPAPTPAPTTPSVEHVAGLSEPLADPLYPQHGNPGLDVLHYDLDLTWQPKTLSGTATLLIRPTADAREIKLDFKPYGLGQVTVDGANVPAAVRGEKLIVSAPARKDRQLTLAVPYRGTPSTTPMPSNRNDAEPLGLTVSPEGGLWTMQEPYGAFTWYPANDHPSDEALYDIAVTVPDGWSAIAGGTPAGSTGSTFRYRSTDPMATYLQTLAVGRYKEITASGPRGLPLSYWYRPGLDERLVPSLRKSPEFLTFLEKRFGPYPFPSGGIVVVDSRSGMETQQMVTIGGRIPHFYPGPFEEDLLHEYAHHWFGDSITPTTWRDLWLSEGWATYAQLLWKQERHSMSDADLESVLRSRDAGLRKQLGPPGKPQAGHFAESNVYYCPAAMLKELNDALGDQRFFALATAWVQTQRNTQQDRASFITFVNKHTGRNFTSLINTWLDSPTTPA